MGFGDLSLVPHGLPAAQLPGLLQSSVLCLLHPFPKLGALLVRTAKPVDISQRPQNEIVKWRIISRWLWDAGTSISHMFRARTDQDPRSSPTPSPVFGLR